MVKTKNMQQVNRCCVCGSLLWGHSVCPNCNSPVGSIFCHICGTPLINDNGKTIYGEGTSKFGTLVTQANSSDINMAIDLGLLSGTRWAPCNVGATKPQERGDSFAWGEIEKKEKYTWKTHAHCDSHDLRLCDNMVWLHHVGFKIRCSSHELGWDAANAYPCTIYGVNR